MQNVTFEFERKKYKMIACKIIKKTVFILGLVFTILIFFNAAPPKKPELNDKTPYLADSIIALGKKLFNDPILSKNKTLSCASCHKKQYYYGDSISFNIGLNGLLNRNTLAFSHIRNNEPRTYFWNGKYTELNNAISYHLADKNIMGMNDSTLLLRMENNAFYCEKFNSIYGKNNLNINTISDALSDFIKNIKYAKPTYNSKLEVPQKNLSANISRTLQFCQQCHQNIASVGLSNNGLYVNDTNLYIIPSLFNLKYTAPYMHDGKFKNLEEVIMHYNTGVVVNSKTDALLIKDGKPIQLELTNAEIKEIAALLLSIQRKIQ